MKPFSKKLLTLDYIITAIMLFVLFVCIGINGFYTACVTNELVSKGMEVYSITPPLSLDIFGIVLTAWISQLAISSGSYYILIRSDHKMEYPVQMIKELPDEVKQQINYNELINTVLSNTGN